jgi:hypothetical protein
VIAVLATALICACAPAAAVAADGGIAGTVRAAAAGHAPIEGARACAASVSFGEDFVCDFTDSSGAYSIQSLSPGQYMVSFGAAEQNFVFQYYDRQASWESATPVPVVSGATTPVIDAELEEGGWIEGDVEDSLGGDAVEAEVCAWIEAEQGGPEALGCAEPGALGHYAIGGLPAGEYAVAFWPFDPSYTPQLYDGRGFWEEPDLVEVVTGAQATGIDAEMRKGGRIAGTVTSAATGAPLDEIEVCVLEATGANDGIFCTYTEADGRYTTYGLPSGAYKVEFSPEWAGGFGDGFPTQYYDGKSTLAQAEPVVVTEPGTTSGIDARLGTPSAGAPILFTPPDLPPASTANKKGAYRPGPRHCRKGFKRRLAKGKVRCVKTAKHRR